MRLTFALPLPKCFRAVKMGMAWHQIQLAALHISAGVSGSAVRQNFPCRAGTASPEAEHETLDFVTDKLVREPIPGRKLDL